MRSFLILHGYQGSGPEHWQSWLAGRLAGAGEDVRYPDLPDPDCPHAADWARALHEELADLPTERTTVVCHSLACLLWAREAAAIAAGGPVERVLLVAPPCPVAPIPDVSDFHPTPLDPEAVAASAGHARVVCAETDPYYCPAGAARSFAAPLRLPADIVPGGSHLNAEAGYGPWPAVEAWCLQPAGAKNGVDT